MGGLEVAFQNYSVASHPFTSPVSRFLGYLLIKSRVMYELVLLREVELTVENFIRRISPLDTIWSYCLSLSMVFFLKSLVIMIVLKITKIPISWRSRRPHMHVSPSLQVGLVSIQVLDLVVS